MKGFLTLLALIVHGVSLAAEPIIVSGHINHNHAGEIILSVSLDAATHTTYDFSDNTDEYGNYKITFEARDIVTGRIILNPKQQLILFLSPGDSLYLTTDEEFPDSISPNMFKGKNNGNDNFIFNSYFFWMLSESNKAYLKIRSSKWTPREFKIEEYNVSEILRKDSNMNIHRCFIDSLFKFYPPSENFRKFIGAEITYENAYNKITAPSFHAFAARDYSIAERLYDSIAYKNYLQGFNLNDESLVNNTNYIRFLGGVANMCVISRKSKEIFREDVRHKIEKEVIDSLFSNKKVRTYVLANFISKEIEFGSPILIQDMIDEFFDLNYDEYLHYGISTKLKKSKSLQPGNFAPSFQLSDINGKEVSLKQFKGKLVYIDFWATSCAPCVAEFPASNRIQILYEDEDIVFLFINIDEDKDRWVKFLREKRLKGVHVFSGGKASEVARLYCIDAIPHYILIGKDGKIIEQNAPRPSSDKFKEFLNTYLPKKGKWVPPKFNPDDY